MGHARDAGHESERFFIEHFFQGYKNLEGRTVPTDGSEDRASALRVVEEARARAIRA